MTDRVESSPPDAGSHASRLLSPEEIAVGGGPQVPNVHLVDRAEVFGDREARLRQRSASHAMRDFLLFMAEVARAQQETLNAFGAVELPDAAALDAAALAGRPPLPAILWPRDAAWREGFGEIIERLLPRLAGAPQRRRCGLCRPCPPTDSNSRQTAFSTA